jgi:putative hydrolase of the HAD superfamily
MLAAMSKLPTAILLDLDDTILAAFGKSAGQWERVVGSFAERLTPHRPEAVIEAIQAYSRYLWADQTRHKEWRHKIGDARRHIVTSALCELAGAAKLAEPDAELCQAIADEYQQIHEAELEMFPGAHETIG